MEKKRFKNYLEESLNDKGIFKAIFIGGVPGAGKTYTVGQINDGAIQPRIVNTDKFIQFISQMHGRKLDKEFSGSEEHWGIIDHAKQLTKTQLSQYINGMLPLIIDGTSNSMNNVLRRMGQLESVGYDTGMIWVNTPLETAITRAASRDRHVDVEFIKDVYSQCEENKAFYETKFDVFIEIHNDEGQMTDDVLEFVFKHSRRFFHGPLQNPVGKRHVQKLKDAGEKYLVPTLFTDEDINNVVSSWYFSQ